MKAVTIKEFFRDRFGDHGMGRVWNWTDNVIVDPQEDFSSSDEDEEEVVNNANPYAPGKDKWPKAKAKKDIKGGTSIDDGGNASSGDGSNGGGDGGGSGASASGGKKGVAGRNVKHADAAEKRMADTKYAPPTPLEKELQDKNHKLQDKNQELQDRLTKVEMALALASTPLPTMPRHDEYEREEMLSQGGWTARSAATSIGGSPPGRHPRRKKVSVQYLPPIAGQMYRNWPLDANTPHRSTDIYADTPQPTSLGPVSMVHSQLPSSNQQSKIHPTTSTYDSPSSRK